MATVKIAIVGPESSGKSELAKALASHFKAPVVLEYARDYFSQKPHQNYTLEDVANIAEVQLLHIREAAKKQPELLFLDTDALTLHIWTTDKFGVALPAVANALATEKPDLYLLCMPDLPWQPDPLREDQHRRTELFEVHKTLLEKLKTPYFVISGVGGARLQNALEALAAFKPGA